MGNARTFSTGTMQQLYAGNKALGYSFDIYFDYYRGTYLSCIEAFEITVDGVAIPQENLVFCVNGKRFLIDQLKDMYMEYWFIEDPATIIVYSEEPLGAGNHNVDLHLVCRVPYSGYNGNYFSDDMNISGVLTMEGGNSNE